MSFKRMEYNKAGWCKYGGRLYPRYEKQSWTVWETKSKGVLFYSFELANIYAILMDIKDKLKKEDVGR